MVFCCVLGCNSDSRKTKNLTYHRYPKDTSLHKIWSDATGRTARGWKPTKHTRFCSLHFRPRCFTKTINSRRLVFDAVPTLHIHKEPPPEDSDSDSDSESDPPSAKRQRSAADQQGTGPSRKCSGDPATDDDENETDPRILNEQALKITLSRIRANPQLYIGLPKNCYHLIKILHKQTQIPIVHILLCLKKVKLDTHFDELADQFGIKPREATHIFMKNLPIISKVLHSFINTDNEDKNDMPTPYRKYQSTTIIETLELNVQPWSAKSEALTQTEHGNTVKYIVSCNSDGFINYVSPGYGGRQSNDAMLENTNYLDRFKPGARIIAHGFNNVEEIIMNKGLKLLKPMPRGNAKQNGVQNEESTDKYTEDHGNSVLYKPMNEDIDRVVQRVKEFTLVQDTAVIRSDLVRVLDDAVIISCALINLQSYVIN